MGVQLFRQNQFFRDVPGWAKATFALALKRHLIFSLPIAGTFLSMTIGNQACMLIYATMSVNDFAALTLILPWVQVAGTFGMAWAQATGIKVAQLLARDVVCSEEVCDRLHRRLCVILLQQEGLEEFDPAGEGLHKPRFRWCGKRGLSRDFHEV